MEKVKVYCPYSIFDMDYKLLKSLDKITFEKPWYLENNTNTSAQPLNEGEDIVRPILNNEGIESQDKEPVS